MADYLSDEEQLEKLKGWWRENGAFILGALALSLAGLAGWRWYDSARIEEMQSASELYGTFLAASDEARTEFAAQLDAEHPDASYRAFSLLHRASEAAAEGDIEDALGNLGALLDAEVHPWLKDLARLRLARLLQEQEQGDAALAALAEVRSPGFSGQASELKGDIHLLRGERELAHEAYVAAFLDLQEDAFRPILKMKIDDTVAAR